MELKNLNTFRTIVKEGSFSKAAETLNYTQSTITFQINQLEEELSVCLFEKIGRKMVLTKAGNQLIPYVDEVLQSVDKLRSFENDLQSFRGDLRVGVAETLLCYKIPEILKEFHRRAPNARLFLRSMNCYDIRNELFNGTLDLGIFYENISGISDGLITRSIGTYNAVLVSSPETAVQFPDFITSGRNIPLSFIIDEPECIFRQIFEQYLREKVIKLDHTIELWSIPTIKNLVKNDMGVSFLPRFTVEEEIQCGELVEIPTEIADSSLFAICAHHKNKWISPLMQLFMDLLTEETDKMKK